MVADGRPALYGTQRVSGERLCLFHPPAQREVRAADSPEGPGEHWYPHIFFTSLLGLLGRSDGAAAGWAFGDDDWDRSHTKARPAFSPDVNKFHRHLM
jgi:hypothetical protein